MCAANHERTDGRDPEASTEGLVERLLAETDVSNYVETMPDWDASVADYLAGLAADRGLTRADVIRKTGVNATFCYQIFSGDRKPGRDTCLTLALGIGASLKETQRLLVRAGVAQLYAKDPRDAVVMHALANGSGLDAADETLWNLGLQTLRKADS
jgi:DNA-binding phage protein